MDPFKPYRPSQRITPAKLTASDAEAVALKAVAWIASDPEMLSRFVDLTGCGEDELRLRLTQPAFLGGVLDFLLGDEPTVLAFIQQEGFAAELPLLARALLP